MRLAWHTARLTAYAPQKSIGFQKLDTLLIDKPVAAARRRQSGAEQKAIFQSWMAGRRKAASAVEDKARFGVPAE